MKIKFLISAFAILFTFGTLRAQQPYAGCWHPDFIRDWTPEKDPDRKFNRSTIPLQERIPTAGTIKAHAQQFSEGQIAACLTMHPMCSQVPSQGANNFIGYNPTYWQYLDLLVWWGGSSDEGIILPPSGPVIDAAHMNGVKVLGQIFFPTTVHSGLPVWTTQMNTKEAGIFPYARKCAEIAKYYGFDGWFINSETITGTNWGEWTADYLAYSKEIGLTGQEIQVYVMSSGTTGAYIEDVAKQKGGSYMVNYGGIATNDVNERMNSHVSNGWGDRTDAFHTWYYGVEQSGSIYGNGTAFHTLFPTTGHIGSVNFFNPEEPIWKKTVTNLLNTPNAQGASAYEAMTTVFENESQFWVNVSGNPSDTRGTAKYMSGLATAVQERSAIQTKPFVTTFSLGLGKHRFVNGEKKGTQDWYHRGMQTVMPTWRWWQTKGYASTSDLSFAYNWDDAYNLGTSVNVTGNLTNDTDYNLFLYKTKLMIAAGDKIQFVYKTNRQGSVRLKLAESSNGLNLQALTVTPSSTTRNGWTVDEYDLSELAGKTIVTIGLGINTNNGNGFTAQLGQLAVYPANYNPTVPQVTHLNVQNELTETRGELRVVWDKPVSNDIHHFNVYLEKNGVNTLVGQVRGEGFFIPRFTRNGQTEKSVKVSVKAVNKKMEEAASGPVKEVLFPDVKLPEVTLTASKTLVTADENVTVTATASNFPEAYTWKASEGATLVSSTGNTAVYNFTKEGLYSIGVDVRNAVGTVTHKEEKFINVSSRNLEIVSRTSNGGKIKDVSSYVLANNEGPQWLIDEITEPGNGKQKWFAGGSKEHWVILKLNQPYELYRFRTYDCGVKENANNNLTHYRIYTSLTGNDDDWTLALDKREVPADAVHNIKDDYIKPTMARYVKFVPYDPDKVITIRIWQFDVWGLPVPQPPFLGDVTVSKPVVQPGEEVSFTVEASGKPTRYEWTIAGGTLVSQTANKAVFTFSEQGFYDVTVTATNENGTSEPLIIKEVLEVSKVFIKSKHPLTLSGFNIDAIAENTPAANYAQSIDNAGWAFYTAGAAAKGALPVNSERIAVSASGTPFRFAPYDGNNAFSIKSSATTSQLTVQEKYKAEYVNLLFTSPNGAVGAFYIFVYYAGETTPALFSTTIQDWYGDATGTALGALGRIKLEATTDYPADQTDIKCRMYEMKVPVNPTKVISGISFLRMIGPGYPTVFAATVDVTVIHMDMERPQDIRLNEGAIQTINAGFTLPDGEKENFAITAKAANNALVAVSKVTIDKKGRLSFEVKGLKAGTTDISIQMVNGDLDMIRKFKVTVDAALTEIAQITVPEIEMAPNPVKAGEMISVKAAHANRIRLLNLQGKTLWEQTVKAPETKVPTAGMRPGIYILQVVGDKDKAFKVIIK